ncbi:hypothetical protein BU14_0231s0023 [Porphyra umbilicalis]|uniref:aspartyl aminopeptidase n=1 Tax=Porphyra umbilicalis TaxID=2786 RepID=A0A1X6P485_PORUM|nr:hypothetical protein BU14_0231s0023 [Porphyra umbilicalis]|eukprot:OSX75570.1 hypothetical protein BU14_0231s0023 [Porphyra umbilicalis]
MLVAAPSCADPPAPLPPAPCARSWQWPTARASAPPPLHPPHPPPLVTGLLNFIDASPSPYHAVAAAAALLRAAGYTALSEASPSPWALTPGGRYFFTRGGASLVAFAVGARATAAAGGGAFKVVGAHTDSPCFKLKPVAAARRSGYVQLGVQTYGGGLWHTWFDRDLTVAGRVVVRDAADGRLAHRLVRVPWALLRIPSLAIHLSRELAKDGFKPDREAHTMPILATVAAAAAAAAAGLGGNDAPAAATARAPSGARAAKTGAATPPPVRHPPELLTVLAAQLGVPAAAIVDVDLSLADTQPCAIGGAHGELVLAPRLDNLHSCYTALTALTAADGTLADEADVRVVALFDHEEVGSTSAVGANSALLPAAFARIHRSLPGGGLDADAAAAAVTRSLLVSADMAHGVHPNYVSKHEERHRPALGGGMVIKTNANQRYATSGATGALLRAAVEAAAAAGGWGGKGAPASRVQEFVVGNETGCGSTIGPMLSARTGMRTVDVGAPQLAMHSVREVAAVADVAAAVDLYAAVFRPEFRALDDALAASGEILE